ncbi:Hypothetical predicted protein [Mytilus galloprovincialis]|uniref:TROVE domain-containing protein n=1 Tax=Mytilus galloprovincialis TaxID=29158 RepID=A0A8B6HP81_MYTGA|nr:Hypothetical predicted protein [Mytilus galloprovincialis]
MEASGSGWGRSMRIVISNWYNSFENNPMRLAYLITKYKAGHGFNHRDVIRLAHVKPINGPTELIILFASQGLEEANFCMGIFHSPTTVEIFEFLVAVEKTSKPTLIDMNELKALLIKHELVKEHIHNNFLRSRDILESLLRQMPVTAMLHNLGKMSKLHFLEGHLFFEDTVIIKLDNIMKEPTIHPLNVFFAWTQYRTGREDK